MMQKLWSQDVMAKTLVGRRVTLICEGKAFEYSSVDGESTQMVTVLELESSQEKTDTRVGFSLCKG